MRTSTKLRPQICHRRTNILYPDSLSTNHQEPGQLLRNIKCSPYLSIHWKQQCPTSKTTMDRKTEQGATLRSRHPRLSLNKTTNYTRSSRRTNRHLLWRNKCFFYKSTEQRRYRQYDKNNIFLRNNSANNKFRL